MMAASRTRPGNPDKGWNDPPMFNFVASTQPGPPKRALNKRVAFPVSGPQQPGHAVLNPIHGPPIVNPVLTPEMQGTPPIPTPVIPIGLRDTPLGNQGLPTSPVQLLPPTVDTSPPQTVPLLVPGFVPSKPPEGSQDGAQAGLDEERLEELMLRLSLQDDEALLKHNLDNLATVLDRYRGILTVKACDEIQKKVDIFHERWGNGTLGETVKLRITQLTIALVEEDTEKANHLHLALMIDHITEVNQWMAGVKRLLQQQQLAAKERELISQSHTEPQADESGETTADNSTQETVVPSGGQRETTADGESQELQQTTDNDKEQADSKDPVGNEDST